MAEGCFLMAKGRVIVELDDGTEHVIQGAFRYTTMHGGKAEVFVTITIPHAVVLQRRSLPDEIQLPPCHVCSTPQGQLRVRYEVGT